MALGYLTAMRPNAYAYGQHATQEKTWHKTLENAQAYAHAFMRKARNVWGVSSSIISIEEDVLPSGRAHGYVLTMEVSD